MKSKIAFPFLFLLLSACKNGDSEPQIPLPPAQAVDGEALEDPFGEFDKITAVEPDATIDAVSAPEPIAADPAAPRYNFDALNPVISCSQDSPAVAGGDGLTVTCLAKNAAGEAFKIGSEPVQLKWTYSHPLVKDVMPKIAAAGEIDSPLSGASFTFPGPNNLAGYYVADSGNYQLEMVYLKDGSQLKKVAQTSTKVMGEGCKGEDTLSFKIASRNFRIIEANSTVRVFGGDNSRFLIESNASLTTDGDNMYFLAPNARRITDRGNGGSAVVLKGVTYVAEGMPKSVFADKGATITAPKDKSFVFNTPLAYCP